MRANSKWLLFRHPLLHGGNDVDADGGDAGVDSGGHGDDGVDDDGDCDGGDDVFWPTATVILRRRPG